MLNFQFLTGLIYKPEKWEIPKYAIFPKNPMKGSEGESPGTHQF
jgi:hypothetical protein